MSDIFREVEEDVRRDQLKALWDQYGPYVIGLALAIIVGTSGYVGWQAYQKNAAEDLSEEFAAAAELSEDAPAEAAAAFQALSEESGGGYGTLAAMHAAALIAEAGDRDAAIAAYDAIAADSGNDAAFRDLARVKAAALLLDISGAADIRSRLQPALADDGAFRHSARELVAFAEYKAGNLDAARTEFRALTADLSAPASIRERATIMLRELGPFTAEELAADEAGGPDAPVEEAPAEEAPAEETQAESGTEEEGAAPAE